MDEDRPRTLEYQESLKRAEAANDAGDLLTPYEPKTMSASEAKNLVLDQVQELDRKYPDAVRRTLDLVFYVNLQDYAVNGDRIDISELPDYALGWRSLSFVSNNCSCVIWAASEAPKFLADKIGKVFHKDPSNL